MATASVDIQILEGFALAADREAYLNDLVSGTQEHFLCSWMLAEQTGYPASLEAGLQTWISSYPYHPFTETYRNRRKLVDLSADESGSITVPQEVSRWLRDHCNLSFSHSQRRLDGDDAEDSTPSALSASELEALTEDSLVRQALSQDYYDSNFLNSVGTATFLHEHPLVLEQISTSNMKFYYYLAKDLSLPDAWSTQFSVKRLSELLQAADVRSSVGYVDAFVESKLYPKLSLEILLALGEAVPALKHRVAWGAQVLSRMAPPTHVDFRVNPEAKATYLREVSAFVATLPQVYNPIHLAITYHQLNDKLTSPASLATPEGKYLLATYMRIPRNSSSILSQEANFFKGLGSWSTLSNARVVVTVGYGQWSSSTPTGSSSASLDDCLAVPYPSQSEDEALMTEALSQLLVVANNGDFAPWDEYASVHSLRQLQAEAKLTRGSDAERAGGSPWPASLSGGSQALAQLRDRVEVSLSPWNTEYVPAGRGSFALSFRAKGVKTATVRIFEINTTAYYTDKKAEIPTDLELDGLLPHSIIEVQLEADETGAGRQWSPLAYYFRTVAIPSVSEVERGVFMIDINAGGTSCRAVVRKGALKFVERRTIAGHLLSVLDENNVPVSAGHVSVTVNGRKYAPKKDDDTSMPQILIPYNSSAVPSQLMLTVEEEAAGSTWSFSTLVPNWEHMAESYTLEAGFFVDRESLIRDNYTAKLIVRPKLLLQGTIQAPLGALKNVTLQITSRDADGSSSTKAIRPFSLVANEDSVATFACPPGLRAITAQLTADIEIMADGRRVALSASHAVAINNIDDSSHTRDAFLRYTSDLGYCVYVLGKSGEPAPKVTLDVRLHHPSIRVNNWWSKTLQTDAEGKIVLGPLRGFSKVIVSSIPVEHRSTSTREAAFDLPHDTVFYSRNIHGTSRLSGGSKQQVQASLPFRVTSADFTLSRAHVRLLEVRPRGGAANSVALGGNIPDAIDAAGQYNVVRDMIAAPESFAQFVSLDADNAQLRVHDLPAGDYQLIIKSPYPGATAASPIIAIRILPAEGSLVVGSFLANGNTFLQAPVSGVSSASYEGQDLPHQLAVRTACPVQVCSVNRTSDSEGKPSIRIKVSGGSSGAGPCKGADARVHVIASYFVPLWQAGASLDSLSNTSLSSSRWSRPRSRFLGSRTIGEEIKYVMDRQAALKSGSGPLPGNLLPRPSLLLNPWSRGTADTGTQDASDGTAFSKVADMFGSSGASEKRRVGGGLNQSNDSLRQASHSSLDFLHQPSVLLSNLRPNEAGEVFLSLDALLPFLAQQNNSDGKANLGDLFLTVVVVDNASMASTTTAISTAGATGAQAADGYKSASVAPFRNLACANTMDMDSHVVQKSKISTLLSVDSQLDLTASAAQTKVETYSSIDRVYSLFSALSNNATLVADWNWLVNWPVLSSEEKAARYSKYACHELNVWVFFKDFTFFETVVIPFIQCKRAKTFVDHWLLGHDMSAYASPEVYSALNAFEQALLCARVGNESAAKLATRVSSATEVRPLTVQQRESIFKAALASNALDGAAPTGDSLQALMRRADKEREAAPKRAPTVQPARNVMSMDHSSRVRSSGRRDEGVHMELLEKSVHMQADLMMDSIACSAPASKPRGMFMARKMAAPAPPSTASSVAMPGSAAPSMEAMSRNLDRLKSMGYRMSDKADVRVLDEFDGEGGGESEADDDLDRREEAREQALFRPLDKTEEYAETHYYRIRSDLDIANVVAANDFWADFATYCARISTAANGSEGMRILARTISSNPFVSTNFGVVGSTLISHAFHLNEMLLALAVLGFPFDQASSPPVPPSVSLMAGTGKVRFVGSTTPHVVFHQDLSVSTDAPSSGILCGQSYFDPQDRHVVQRGVTREKYVPWRDSATGQKGVELLAGKVYGCIIVVTNVASFQQNVDVLVHLPEGSLPVSRGFVVKSQTMSLGAYSTQRFEYYFYIPRNGSYYHYPVHISSEGTLLAYSSPVSVSSVSRTEVRDTTSWLWISQMGSHSDVIHYLSTANLHETDLSLALWRCKDEDNFRQIYGVLKGRMTFSRDLWGYAVHHLIERDATAAALSSNDAQIVREFLQHPSTLAQLAYTIFRVPVITSPLLRVRGESGAGAVREEPADDIAVIGNETNVYDAAAAAYEHLEYSPLVNARAHMLGSKRSILNKAVERQYRSLLTVMVSKAAKDITPSDWLSLTYHLLLQDRVSEAMATFARVAVPTDSATASNFTGSNKGSWQTLQYDYMAAYMDFFHYDPTGAPYNYPVASTVARAYAKCPIPKWAAKFKEINTQLQEALSIADGRTAGVTSPIGSGESEEERGVSKELSREAQQSKAAANAPALDLAVDSGIARITYANLADIVLRFYSMDIEVLFSTSPFLTSTQSQSGSPDAKTASASSLGQFAFLRPNGVFRATLTPLGAGKQGEEFIQLPDEFAKQNVMVEVVSTATGLRKALPYFATDLSVSITESYGRLKVTHAKTGEPQPRVYVKVYYRTNTADKGRFFKDGYTDARGVFDYTSISTDELSKTQRFSILVVSEVYGACIREAAPPAV